MSFKINFLTTFVVFLSINCFAHEGGGNEHAEEEERGILGSLEVRPSIESASGDKFGENTLELGYKFSKKFRLGLQQEVHHNIGKKQEVPEHEEPGVHLEEGFLNAHLHEVWESSDESASVSLEPRLYLPTSSEEREKGYVTAALTYIKLRTRLTESSSITFMNAPVFFFYSQAGAQTEHEFEANPNFQNRFRISFDTKFLDGKLSISLPALFYLTGHSDYDSEAEHNNQWTSYVGFAPEIGYALTSNLTAGLAVLSPNVLDAEIVEHSINHGRKSTVTQMVLRAEL